MFRIIIVPSNSSANIALAYRTREAAEIEQKNIHEMQKGTIDAAVLTAKDDYGNVVTIDRANISYALFIDVEKAQNLMVEQAPPHRVAPRSTILEGTA